jgi:SAM-dependent methyltransferase
MIRWFSDVDGLAAEVCELEPQFQAVNAAMATSQAVPGYCTACEASSRFVVDVGCYLGEYPSLREGLVCPACGLNNRSRLLLQALVETVPPDDRPGAVLEATTPLFRALRRRYSEAIGSEYFDGDAAPGSIRRHNGAHVRHESIVGLSYATASMAFVVHNDVLEHVADTARAMSECRRVLVDGGACVFTMPFFPYRASTLVRGRLGPGGAIEHLQPPEYHGDGLRSGGIYTFYHFGRDFVRQVAAAGFRRVEVGLCFDPYLGHTSNNHRYGVEEIVAPTIFRASA